MTTNEQIRKAEKFQEMHRAGHMFVIPNAWDAGSAVVFEKEGFPCVATSSAGIAYALGYPDGEDISFDDLLDTVQKITRRVSIPVSVDFERGYSEDPEQVKKNAGKLLEAGAVGFNIEDGLPDAKKGHQLSPLAEQIEKIKALVSLKSENGIDFVINARTCAYWLNTGTQEEMFREAVERCNAFREAGADCVFVPGPMDGDTVRSLAKHIHAPINIILNGKFHDMEKLDEIGIRRLSVGSGPARAVCEKAIHMAALLKSGNPDEILDCKFTYNQANEYFRR